MQLAYLPVILTICINAYLCCYSIIYPPESKVTTQLQLFMPGFAQRYHKEELNLLQGCACEEKKNKEQSKSVKVSFIRRCFLFINLLREIYMY